MYSTFFLCWRSLPIVLTLILVGNHGMYAFDLSRRDNLATYWGQSATQQSLVSYCDTDTTNMIPLAFLTVYPGPGDLPVVDLSHTCNIRDNPSSSTPGLPDCSFLAQDIAACQNNSKAITLSLGGATGSIEFSDADNAREFADMLWAMFLGGSGETRPFGDAVLDGIDLDIEGGSQAFYPDFLDQLRTHMSAAPKKYYITASPQCPFPDSYLGDSLTKAVFDAIFVQFYNNKCGLSTEDFNFAEWDNWARSNSVNKDVKIFIGLPGSPASAGSGYVEPSELASALHDVQAKYDTFGGVMLWDADSAYTNERYDETVKSIIVVGNTMPAPMYDGSQYRRSLPASLPLEERLQPSPSFNDMSVVAAPNGRPRVQSRLFKLTDSARFGRML